MRQFFLGLGRKAGLDFHILLTLSSRLWTVFAGAVMILGLPHWLSGAEQGFYFTFYSLVGLQVFFEMGLNYVVIQFAGHEAVHLRFDGQGGMAGPNVHLDRLGSLVGLLHRWYCWMAILYAVVVAVAGVAFFSRNNEIAFQDWAGPWLLLVGFSALNLYVSPFLSVAEGCGFVGQVARVRMLMSVLGYLVMWGLLGLGAGLWAVPCSQACAAVGGSVWLKHRVRFIDVLRQRSRQSGVVIISWRKEIFPFQWRIALSWISGYFIFQLFNPILFSRQGALEAGRAGLALTIFSTLLGVSMSWVTAKAPVIAGLLARGEMGAAKVLFRGLMLRSAAFNMAGCVAVCAGVWILRSAEVPLAGRLPGLFAIFCISVATFSNHLVSAMAVFIRAHKKEPLALSSGVMALLSICAVYFAAGHGLNMVMGAYAALAALVGLPWCGIIFRPYWRASV